MKRNANHALLNDAKNNRRDEFYTQLSDIERELVHYKKHFRGKVVFCNCDDARISNFFKYFLLNFESLGLKKLVCACYKKSECDLFQQDFERGHYYEYTGTEKKKPRADDLAYFRGDGDFRSAESIELLKQSDIVVTNPPFSLFREYFAQLINYNKKFLIIGNINAITYKEVFNLIKKNRVWLGVNMGRGISGFIVPEHYELYGQETRINAAGERIISPNNCLWLTNLDNSKRHEFIPLVRKYFGNEAEYPRYDNFDAINVDQTKDIPADYGGAMGVPITFLHKFNPDQFEIIRFRKGDDEKDLTVNGKSTYFRILIRRKSGAFVGGRDVRGKMPASRQEESYREVLI